MGTYSQRRGLEVSALPPRLVWESGRWPIYAGEYQRMCRMEIARTTYGQKFAKAATNNDSCSGDMIGAIPYDVVKVPVGYPGR